MSVHLLTSESVTSGHPDKLCDYISDSILDECLRHDSEARVAVEVFVKSLKSGINNKLTSYIIIGGEVTLKEGISINFENIARNAAYNVGYNSDDTGMDAKNKINCKVMVMISTQSRDISQGVSEGEGLDKEQGAGDQGVMYGYACDESELFEELQGTFMPLPILLSHRLTNGLTEARKNNILKWARPDGKSQVTLAYDKLGNPSHIDTIIIALQHENIAEKMYSGDIEKERMFIEKEIKEKIIDKLIPPALITDKLKIIINGTGRFLTGGPLSDTGLTGRKIIVDTYGGIGRHGGGAFSGKDPTKVDRSGAYMARWVAKHIVASKMAKKCEIQVSYAIGIANPVSINIGINTFNSSNKSNDNLEKMVKEIFDFRPISIINKLDLKTPIYSKVSSGGHFGYPSNNTDLSWEILDNEIIKKINNYGNKN